MHKLFIPLLAFLIVGCSGTKINKEGQKEIIDYMFEWQEEFERKGKEEACGSYTFTLLRLQQKKLYLEHTLDKTGYLSDVVHSKVNKIRNFCGDFDFRLD